MSLSTHSETRQDNRDKSSESHLSPPPLLEKEPSLGVPIDRGERTSTMKPPAADRNKDAPLSSDAQNLELTSATEFIGESPGFNKFLRDHRGPLYNKYQQIKGTQNNPQDNDCEFAQFTSD